MRYKAHNKQAVLSVMRGMEIGAEAQKKIDFWDFSQWPRRWEEGAKILETSSPGKLITAPIRVPEALLTATKKTAEEIPGTVKKLSSAVPLIAIAAAIVGTGVIIYKLKKK